MKKVVFASVLALATTTLGAAPMMIYAQDQGAQAGQITIKDPAEYNAYTNAVGAIYTSGEGHGDRGISCRSIQILWSRPICSNSSWPLTSKAVT